MSLRVTSAAAAFLAVAVASCGGASPSPSPAATGPASPAAGSGAAPGALPSGHPPMGGLPAGHPAVGEGAAAAADDARAISGTVELGSGMKAAGSVLYVIARGKDGQIQGVQRVEVKAFPAPFRVGPADAMTAGTPFEGPFDVTARLSRTGDAIPAPGDVEGTTRGVKPGAKGVTVVLDTVRK